MTDSLRDQLQELLAEGVEIARQREIWAHEAVAGASTSKLILHGAGGFGRRALAGLRSHGIEPLAFTDNNSALWGRQVEGVTVLAPDEAARQHGGDAVFVITIWRAESSDKMSARVDQLRKLGCRTVVPFGPLFWKYPEHVLPHYGADLPHKVHEHSSAILKAFDLWADEASRAEYLAQIRWRLFMDFDVLPDPAPHPIYFPKDRCALTTEEVFVDCGAFDGDTIRLFLRECDSHFKQIVAFEPDPENFVSLGRKVGELPEAIRRRITIQCAATGAENGRVRFSAEGNRSSFIGQGELDVELVKLDSALAGVAPTYVKMDIEGAEPDALTGAAAKIREHTPVLAISSYHRQDHLWSIPLLIQSLNPGYRFLLRPHDLEMWDLVCYAIPADRFIAG